MAHPFAARWGRTVEKERWERVVSSESCGVIGKDSSEDTPSIFSGLVHFFSRKTPTFLKCSSVVAYSFHIVWLNVTQKQARYLLDYGQTLLDSPQVERGAVERERQE